jgi:regulator of replication initiation timing
MDQKRQLSKKLLTKYRVLEMELEMMRTSLFHPDMENSDVVKLMSEMSRMSSRVPNMERDWKLASTTK